MKISVGLNTGQRLAVAMPGVTRVVAIFPQPSRISIAAFLPAAVITNHWQWQTGVNLLWDNGSYMRMN